MKEAKRRKGYYPYKTIRPDESHDDLPSVSKIVKGPMNEGLAQWIATNAGTGVLWALRGLITKNPMEESLGREGWLKWACEQSGETVVKYLQKLERGNPLESQLNSSTCIEWAKDKAIKAYYAELNRTADFGTNVHKAIEQNLKKEDIIGTYSENELTACNTFLDAYSDIGFEPSSVEASVYSEKHGVRWAGRIDLALNFDAKQAKMMDVYMAKNSERVQPGLVITDFKTGSIYPQDQKAKLAGYIKAYEETYGGEVSGGLLFNIPRESPDELICYYYSKETMDEAFEKGFLTYYNNWLWHSAPKWFLKQEEEHRLAANGTTAIMEKFNDLQEKMNQSHIECSPKADDSTEEFLSRSETKMEKVNEGFELLKEILEPNNIITRQRLVRGLDVR